MTQIHSKSIISDKKGGSGIKTKRSQMAQETMILKINVKKIAKRERHICQWNTDRHTSTQLAVFRVKQKLNAQLVGNKRHLEHPSWVFLESVYLLPFLFILSILFIRQCFFSWLLPGCGKIRLYGKQGFLSPNSRELTISNT